MSVSLPSEQFVHLSARGPDVRLRGTPSCAIRVDQVSTSRAADGVEWEWDGRALTVTTGRFATYPVYYWAGVDEVCVSPSFTRAVTEGAPLDLDAAAVASFLWRGSCLGDDTLLANVRRLPPAGRLEWHADGRWTVTGGLPRLSVLRLSRDAAIDAFIDTFRAAVRRRAPAGEVIVPLTGGRDSRHIVCELVSAGIQPATVTIRNFPPPRDNDETTAALVARALGVEHAVVPQRASQLDSALRANAMCEFAADWHGWMVPLVEHCERHAGASLFAGYGGDALSRGRRRNAGMAALWQSGDVAAIAAAVLCGKPSLNDAITRFLGPDARARFGFDVAHDRLSKEVARHVDQPDPTASYNFWTGLRRRTAPLFFPACADRVDVRMPYVDDALFDLLASLPLDMELDTDFHTEAIARAFPRWADLPYTRPSWKPDHSEAMRQWAADLARYARTLDQASIVDITAFAGQMQACADGEGQPVRRLHPRRFLPLLQFEAWLAEVGRERPSARVHDPGPVDNGGG